jgi:multidrug efflux pump subunit AcrA (membrane-fusion protein)
VARPVLEQPSPEAADDGPVSDPVSHPGPVGPPDLGPATGVSEPSRFSPFRIGVAVVLVAAALVAWSLTGNAATTYRTAVVGTDTVQATLDSVGTVTPVNQAGLNFNASGTVSAVDVSVGQQVAPGQTLASLNIATLDAAVTSATADLAAAQATLASAEASQTQASTAVSSPAPSTTPTTPAPSSASAAQSAQGTKKITQLQGALTTAQNQVDAASAQATAALTAATAQCEVPPAGTSATSTTTTSLPSGTAASPAPALSPPAGGQSGTAPGAGGTPTGGGAAPATCSQALSQASSAQASVATDLKKVAQAEAALNAALASGGSSSSASSGSSPAGGSGSGGTGSPSTTKAATPVATPAATPSSASASPASTSGSGASRKASPQQLVVDQASIDTAQANLNAAEQAVTGVNLVSSIAGTVASVSISDGVSVTAGGSQSTPEIVVIGSGSAYRVSTAIPVADIGKVAVGQEAVVTPDSTGTVMTGRVASIGVLATSGTTSTTYPVTISLDSPDLGQLSGADAGVSIVVKRSVDVTAVPTSAVHAAGTRHIVDVVVGGTIKPVLVSVGTVGDTMTEVTSGVSPGQVVSLADLGAPLPSTSVTTRTGVGGLGGGSGLGGGGFGGAGGFPGGGGARPAG